MFLLGICWHGYAAEGTGWENEKFLQWTLNYDYWRKKGKGFASLETRRNIPGFPLFRLQKKYFRVVSHLFLPLLTLVQHPPPALSSSALRTPPAPYSPGFAPHLSSSIFSSKFSFQNTMELEALAWTHLLITSTFSCVNKIWRYTWHYSSQSKVFSLFDVAESCRSTHAKPPGKSTTTKWVWTMTETPKIR